MKTLTEFSGIILRKALDIKNDIQPKAPLDDKSDGNASSESKNDSIEAKPASENTDAAPATAAIKPEAPAEDIQAPAPDDKSGEAEASETNSSKTVDAAASAPDEAQTEESTTEDAPEAKEEVVNPYEEKIKAAIDEQLGLSGDRLDRIMMALDAVPAKFIKTARLVRVYEADEAPPKAFSKENIHFIVDKIANKAQSKPADKKGFGRDSRKNNSRGGSGGRSKGRDDSRGKDGDRVHKSQVPSGGLGWGLTRAPKDPNDKPFRNKKRKFNKKKRGPRPGGNVEVATRHTGKANANVPAPAAKPAPEPAKKETETV